MGRLIVRRLRGIAAGAIQGRHGSGKSRPMKIQSAHRRRSSRAPLILGLLALGLIGFLLWLASRDTEVATTRVELDVTNEALAK